MTSAMLAKFVIVALCLCIAQATYIVSVPEDGFDESANLENASPAMRSCNPYECNQFCRRLGHARGVCIGTYCQCRMRRTTFMKPVNDIQDANTYSDEANDASNIQAVSQKETSQAEDFVSRAVIRICRIAACRRACQRFGAIGVCAGGRCFCRRRISRDNSESAYEFNVDENVLNDELNSEITIDEDVADAVENSEPLRDCNLRWCEQNCRRIGFPGGVCVNGRCKCDILRSALPEPLAVSDAIENPEPLRDCNLRWCEQNCRRIGFPGGVCVNGRCKCDILRSALPEPVTVPDAIENPEPLRDCNLRWCEQNCRRMGFPGGVCVNGRCKCDIRRSALPEPFTGPDAVENPEPLSDCNLRWCEQNCRRIGFSGGVCVNGRCKCDILRSAQPEPSVTHDIHNSEEIVHDDISSEKGSDDQGLLTNKI